MSIFIGIGFDILLLNGISQESSMENLTAEGKKQNPLPFACGEGSAK